MAFRVAQQFRGQVVRFPHFSTGLLDQGDLVEEPRIDPGGLVELFHRGTRIEGAHQFQHPPVVGATQFRQQGFQVSSGLPEPEAGAGLGGAHGFA